MILSGTLENYFKPIAKKIQQKTLMAADYADTNRLQKTILLVQFSFIKIVI